jgi:hypothetical protein
MSAPRGFRYPLVCLLKKHAWDEQALRQELATAQGALVHLQEEAATLRRGVAELNAELVRMRDGIRAMDLIGQQRVIAWRDSRDDLLRRKLQQVGQAQALHEQILQQLASTRHAVRGHENHRDRLAQEHRVVAERAAAVHSDDEWLLRRHATQASR